MFEPHMDEYLDEEIEQLKQAFESICGAWHQTVHIPAQVGDSFQNFEVIVTVVINGGSAGHVP